MLDWLMTSAFLPIWFLCVGLILYAASNKEKPNAKKIQNVIRLIVFCLGIGIIGLGWFTHMKSKNQMESIFKQVIQRTYPKLTFQIDRQVIVVSNGAEIETFLNILRTEPAIQAHHSSPVGQVAITFEGVADRFLLGADSKNKDEYWFEMEVISNTYPSGFIKQFESANLTTWMSRNVISALKTRKG